jgi:hypothetical protein
VLDINPIAQPTAEIGYPNRTESSYFTARELIYLYFAMFAFFALVLSPYYLTDFAHSDDWNLFDPTFWSQEPALAIKSGRFLYIVFLRAVIFPFIKMFHLISVLPYLRMASIALLAVAASLLAVHLRVLRMPFLVALCVSALIFILPGALQYVEHVNEFVLILGLVFGLIGGMLLTWCDAGILRGLGMSRRDWLLISASILMLLIACNTYPASGMFFLLPIASTFLFSPDGVRERCFLAIAQVGLFCAGLILFFLSNKFVIIPVSAKLIPEVNDPAIGYYHFDLGLGFIQRLTVGLTELLPAAARLWWFEFKYAGYVVILVVLLGTLSLAFWPIRREPNRRSLVWRIEPLLMLAFVLSAGLLANSPAIMSTGGGLLLRLLFPCSALFVLLLVWIGMRLLQTSKDKFRAVLIAAVLVAGVSAHLTAQSSANNSSIEVATMREAIGRLVQSKVPVKELFIIRPPDSPSYVGARAFSRDEFFTPSSTNQGFAVGMVRVLAQELLTPWSKIDVFPVEPVTEPAYFYGQGAFDGFDPVIYDATCKDGLIYLHEDAVIADMAAPLYLAPSFMSGRNRGSCVREFAYFKTFPEVGPAQSSLRLFEAERSQASYWEARPYPVVFRLRYERPKIAKSYALEAAEFDPARMPVSWRFEASGEDSAWVTLDEQQDQPRWRAGEQREYPIAKPDAYRYYRLVFTKGLEKVLRISKITINAFDAQEPMWAISYTRWGGQQVVEEVTRPHGTSSVERLTRGNFTVEMDLQECRTVSRYGFWVGSYGTDSTDRQPSGWKLFVRGNDGRWALADTEQINDPYSNDKWYSFPLHAGNGCVQRVRWEIAGARKGNIFRLFDFQLY